MRSILLLRHWVVDIILLVGLATLLGGIYVGAKHDEETRLHRYEHAMTLARTSHDTLLVELTFQRQLDRDPLQSPVDPAAGAP